MSRVNTVHGLHDHDLRGIVRASRISPKGIILGVFFDGKFNRESSVIPVKLSVKKDSLIKRVGEKIHGTMPRSWSRRTSVFLTTREKKLLLAFSRRRFRKFHRG